MMERAETVALVVVGVLAAGLIMAYTRRTVGIMATAHSGYDS